MLFSYNFLFLGSIYIPNFRKCYQTVWILPISSFLVNFCCFLAKKKGQRCQNRKIVFLKHFLLLGSIYIPNFRKFQTVWILPIFFIFGKFWLFSAKKGQERPKSKKKFLCSIFFCQEVSTYQISENFIKRLGFCQFSSFLVNFGCFLFFGKILIY